MFQAESLILRCKWSKTKESKWVNFHEDEEVNKKSDNFVSKRTKHDLDEKKYAVYMMNVHKECFENEQTTYVIEIPVKEHGRADVLEAKAKELENLKKFGVLEEVDDDGQDTVGTRWVITKKEPQDGQKTKVKGHLVTKASRSQNHHNLTLLQLTENQ